MSGTIGTINIPNFDTTTRTPGVDVGIDGSQANTATTRQRTLLIGQMTAAGTATAGSPAIVGNPTDVVTLAGNGSLLTQMATRYFAQDPNAEVWILPVADASGSTAAAGNFTISGTATSAGTVAIYIGGVPYAVGVQIGDTAAAIASNLSASSTFVGAPFGIAANGATFTVVFLHGGLAGNDLDIRVNYGGLPAGESLPAGISVAITPMSGGTVNPDLNLPLGNLSDRPYDFIVCPYTDSASLDAIQTFLSDSAGRWSPTDLLFGHAFGSYRGTYGDIDTFGASRNDKHMSILPFYDSPDPVWIWATDCAANCAASVRANPNLPLQYIGLGVNAPPTASRLLQAQRNTLLFGGMSTFTVNDAGQVILERMVTTYQTNAAGAPDNSFLDTETDYALMDLIRDWRTQMLTQFARKILVIDGSILSGGTAMVTSQTVRAATISWYNRACLEGRAQDPAGFRADCLAQNAGMGQVRVLLPFRLDNQLRQIDANVLFTKP